MPILKLDKGIVDKAVREYFGADAAPKYSREIYNEASTIHFDQEGNAYMDIPESSDICRECREPETDPRGCCGYCGRCSLCNCTDGTFDAPPQPKL